MWRSADGYLSKQSACRWVLTVHRYLPTCFFFFFFYSYEVEFVQSLLQAGKKHLAQQFIFTYRYIDDVLSLTNTKFAEYLEFIYPRVLEIKETTEAAPPPHTWFVFSTLTMESLLLGFTTNGMTLIFPLLTFHS